MASNKGRFKSDVFVIIFLFIIIVSMIVFEAVDITLSPDERANVLLRDCLFRGVASIFALAICLVDGHARAFNPLNPKRARPLLWCLPALLVVLANFPFSALISDSARIVRGDLLWAFVLNCLLIGVYEECLFRVFLQSALYSVLQNAASAKAANNKSNDAKTDEKTDVKSTIGAGIWLNHCKFTAALITSAIFAASHLLNLFSGAGVGATFLQVGYSFLIGGMLSAVMFRTGNAIICIILHAVFDAGGYLIHYIGSGTFQDTLFWILTAVCGILCLAHTIIYLWNDSEPAYIYSPHEQE